MNIERMKETSAEQRAINAILGNWNKTMNEDHYYSLRNTLLGLLAYNMDNSDSKPEVNPLVKHYQQEKTQ
jgi:hypothetical protein